MKILFLSDNFPPEVNAPATRTYEHCKEWVKNGNEVTVITSFPNFPIGKVYKGYKNKLYDIELLDGIKVIRVWTYITKNKGIFGRSLDYFSFFFSSFISGLFVTCDIIIGTSPQFFTPISASLLSFLKRKKWIFEVRDIWPESIYAVNAISKKNILISFLRYLEIKLYNSANHIVVVTDSFKKDIIQKGVKPNKISVFKNGCNLDFFKPSAPHKDLLKKYNLKKKIVIGYIGTLGMAHGLDFILNSINNLNNDRLHFLFIGEGSEKNRLLKIKNKNKINNATFIDMVPKSKLINYFNLIDISLVCLRKSKTFLSVIPSKIFESVAMGKPILLGLEGESKKIIEMYNAGITYKPENKKDFLISLNKIINQKIYMDKKKSLKLFSEAYDRTKIANEFELLIKKL